MILLLVSSLSGCTHRRIHKSPWLVTERDVTSYLEESLVHENADTRREALVRVSRTRFADHDVVIDACSTIARTDHSDSVRAVAVRMIAESRGDDAAAILLDVLSAEETIATARSTPDDRVRIEALHGLYYLCRNDAVSIEDRNAVAASAVKLLRTDSSRDLRIATAMLLGELSQSDVLEALIAALRHTDFGVVYHAERSLRRLTGMALDHDPQAWSAWLATNDEPFSLGRREDPLDGRSSTRNWWQRMTTRVMRAFRTAKSEGA